jgi:hypothetical protein
VKPSLVEISIPGVPVQWVFCHFWSTEASSSLVLSSYLSFRHFLEAVSSSSPGGHFPLFPLFPTVFPLFTTQNPGICDGERASLRGFLLEPPGSLSWLSFRRGDDQIAERDMFSWREALHILPHPEMPPENAKCPTHDIANNIPT